MKLNIDKRIRKYRVTLGLTQEELAARLGVTHQSISKWENGDGYPDITFLPALANQFHITVDELIGNDVIGRKEELDRYGKQFDELVKKYDEKVLCPYCKGQTERSFCGTVYTSTGKSGVKCSGNCKTCGGCK